MCSAASAVVDPVDHANAFSCSLDQHGVSELELIMRAETAMYSVFGQHELQRDGERLYKEAAFDGPVQDDERRMADLIERLRSLSSLDFHPLSKRSGVVHLQSRGKEQASLSIDAAASFTSPRNLASSARRRSLVHRVLFSAWLSHLSLRPTHYSSAQHTLILFPASRTPLPSSQYFALIDSLALLSPAFQCIESLLLEKDHIIFTATLLLESVLKVGTRALHSDSPHQQDSLITMLRALCKREPKELEQLTSSLYTECVHLLVSISQCANPKSGSPSLPTSGLHSNCSELLRFFATASKSHPLLPASARRILDLTLAKRSHGELFMGLDQLADVLCWPTSQELAHLEQDLEQRFEHLTSLLCSVEAPAEYKLHQQDLYTAQVALDHRLDSLNRCATLSVKQRWRWCLRAALLHWRRRLVDEVNPTDDSSRLGASGLARAQRRLLDAFAALPLSQCVQARNALHQEIENLFSQQGGHREASMLDEPLSFSERNQALACFWTDHSVRNEHENNCRRLLNQLIPASLHQLVYMRALHSATLVSPFVVLQACFARASQQCETHHVLASLLVRLAPFVRQGDGVQRCALYFSARRYVEISLAQLHSAPQCAERTTSFLSLLLAQLPRSYTDAFFEFVRDRLERFREGLAAQAPGVHRTVRALARLLDCLCVDHLQEASVAGSVACLRARRRLHLDRLLPTLAHLVVVLRRRVLLADGGPSGTEQLSAAAKTLATPLLSLLRACYVPPSLALHPLRCFHCSRPAFTASGEHSTASRTCLYCGGVDPPLREAESSSEGAPSLPRSEMEQPPCSPHTEVDQQGALLLRAYLLPESARQAAASLVAVHRVRLSSAFGTAAPPPALGALCSAHWYLECARALAVHPRHWGEPLLRDRGRALLSAHTCATGDVIPLTLSEDQRRAAFLLPTARLLFTSAPAELSRLLVALRCAITADCFRVRTRVRYATLTQTPLFPGAQARTHSLATPDLNPPQWHELQSDGASSQLATHLFALQALRFAGRQTARLRSFDAVLRSYASTPDPSPRSLIEETNLAPKNRLPEEVDSELKDGLPEEADSQLKASLLDECTEALCKHLLDDAPSAENEQSQLSVRELAERAVASLNLALMLAECFRERLCCGEGQPDPLQPFVQGTPASLCDTWSSALSPLVATLGAGNEQKEAARDERRPEADVEHSQCVTPSKDHRSRHKHHRTAAAVVTGKVGSGLFRAQADPATI
eukprot:CAMPEP_0177678288 /NCGR_PEP_ID=MMETSP0447-20121125/28927_1 /TAXON_ID=0 /ORGANISM="Stygamoeba regulata, Strain BSH-02190019" /LENGTH=1227 /DNA_ID=CAMNT_0019187277 /DNA_START=87 /DNA_END=3768 /DNA_ORIENTATION=+